MQDVSTRRSLSTAEYKVVSSLLGVCLLHHKVQASGLMYCVDLCVVEVMYVCIVNSIEMYLYQHIYDHANFVTHFSHFTLIFSNLYT